MTTTDSTLPTRRRAPPIDFDTLPACALASAQQVLPIVGFSAPTLWRRVKDGSFPKPVSLPGGRSTRWRVGEVREWLAALQVAA